MTKRAAAGGAGGLQVGVSRPTVRTGLHALSAMGVVWSRRGSGTYIHDGPPVLVSGPLRFQAALHGFTRDQMYEVRRLLEVGAATMAAERATSDHLAAVAEHVAGLFASLDDPQASQYQADEPAGPTGDTRTTDPRSCPSQAMSRVPADKERSR